MTDLAIQRELETKELSTGRNASVPLAPGAVDAPGALSPVPRPRPLVAAAPQLRPAAAGQPGHRSAPNPGRPSAAAAAPPAAPAAPPDSDALLKLVQTALISRPFRHTAAKVASELATVLRCERVFIGTVERRFVKVRGVSHGTALGKDQAKARCVGAAMDEALDQGVSVLFPQHPDDAPRITLAHAELARGGGCVLTVPMFNAGRPVGALSFERPLSGRFDTAELRRIEAIGAALAPVLLLQAEHERSFWQRLRGPARHQGAGAEQRHPMLAWLGGLLGVATLVAVLALPWAFQISASTRLEGQMQRAIAAPLDGYLKSAHVRAGDSVREGQLLAELNDDELRLERRRWETEVARHENTFAEAQAKEDRTQLVIADARVAESRAQLAQVDQQIARTQLLAPFDALVIKGDLTQQLGAPVKRGDLLLTLTPSREFRVVLEIDERDVGHLAPGKRGAVTLSALPDRSFNLVIERVMPVARADAGRNLFEAEARLEGLSAADAAALRPGLLGMARLDVGKRPLAWLLSHRVIDWLRLQWWSWLG